MNILICLNCFFFFFFDLEDIFADKLPLNLSWAKFTPSFIQFDRINQKALIESELN